MQATERILDVVSSDKRSIVQLGLHDDFDEELEELVEDLQRYLKDPQIRKNDTSLQMNEVAETMAEIRAWLIELRMLAALELSLDTPTLKAAFSSAPEICDPYPRDLLEELVKKCGVAKDLRARLEDVGVNDRFVSRGKRLAHQLRTAIGKEDLDKTNLQMKIVRHYMKKGRLLMLLKRVSRAGQFAFRKNPEHARQYHLDEVEPPWASASSKRSS